HGSEVPASVGISLNVQGAVGGSTASNEALEWLQGGGHDPKKNGFTFQQAELGLSASAQENLSAEAILVASEHGVELEEAFVVLSSLPGDTEVKAGYFLTEFGLQNASHPHEWNWIDQSVINTRMFGGEGTRGAGARASLIMPAPWYSEVQLTLQDASGDFMTSFLTGTQGHSHDHGEEAGHDHAEEHEHEHAEERGDDDAAQALEEAGLESGIGGWPVVGRETDDFEDLVYAARWINRFYPTPEWMTQIGVSGMQGPNFTGDGASTWLAGIDWVLQWQSPEATSGRPFFRLESEWIYRDLEAAEFALELEDGDHLHEPGTTLTDWGFYIQALYGFDQAWSAGLRFDYASGDGESLGGREQDPYRADRIRISPLLTYQLQESARIKLQYNYDQTDALEDQEAHSVWVALDVSFGAHNHSH
ncbi:MAG: hypothetical protein KDL10_11500, partial [Kiritimatiellae bacterium]|nr:hypothetical protein [Kiritimatiellia bacterium]